MQDELRALIERHCVTLIGEAAAVRDCLARLADPAADRAAVVAQGAGLAHKIKGSSGSIGFGEISRAAQALEVHLRELARLEGRLDEAQVERAIGLGRELEAQTAAIRPEHSALYGAV